MDLEYYIFYVNLLRSVKLVNWLMRIHNIKSLISIYGLLKPGTRFL